MIITNDTHNKQNKTPTKMNQVNHFGFEFYFQGTTVLDTKTTASQWTSGETAATRVR